MTEKTTEQVNEKRIKSTYHMVNFMFYVSAIVTGIILSHGNRLGNINGKLEQLSTNSVPALTIQNTLGNENPERFYQFGTNRAYLEIDGKSIENYFLEERK